MASTSPASESARATPEGCSSLARVGIPLHVHRQSVDHVVSTVTTILQQQLARHEATVDVALRASSPVARCAAVSSPDGAVTQPVCSIPTATIESSRPSLTTSATSTRVPAPPPTPPLVLPSDVRHSARVSHHGHLLRSSSPSAPEVLSQTATPQIEVMPVGPTAEPLNSPRPATDDACTGVPSAEIGNFLDVATPPSTFSGHVSSQALEYDLPRALEFPQAPCDPENAASPLDFSNSNVPASCSTASFDKEDVGLGKASVSFVAEGGHVSPPPAASAQQHSNIIRGHEAAEYRGSSPLRRTASLSQVNVSPRLDDKHEVSPSVSRTASFHGQRRAGSFSRASPTLAVNKPSPQLVRVLSGGNLTAPTPAVRALPGQAAVNAASGSQSPAPSHAMNGPAIKATAALTGMVFSSGAELVKHLNDTRGAQSELFGQASPASTSLDTSAPGGPPGAKTTTEKWKHRVKHIQGPVQVGAKDTLFAVRSEIETMHRRYPTEAAQLRHSIETTKAEVAQVFALVNSEEFQKDTQELISQIQSTQQQVEEEVAEHAKMVSLLESAVATLQQSTDGPLVVPGVQDASTLTPKELDKFIAAATDPLLKKRLAVRAFQLRCEEKVKEHRATTTQALEVISHQPNMAASASQRALQEASTIAARGGVSLTDEVHKLPPQPHLDSAALAVIEEDLLHQAGGAVAAGTTNASAHRGDESSNRSGVASISLSSLAGKMSSLRQQVSGGAQQSAEANAPAKKKGTLTAVDTAAQLESKQLPPAAGRSEQQVGAATQQLSTALSAPSQQAAQSVELRRTSVPHSGGVPNALGDSTRRVAGLAASGVVPLNPSALANAPQASFVTPLSTQSSPRGTIPTLVSSSHQLTQQRRNMIDNVVYTSAQRQDDAKKILALVELLRLQAKTAVASAVADYQLRLKKEEEQARKLAARTMDQVLKDAMENRAQTPINHIRQTDVDRIKSGSGAAEALAATMEALHTRQLQSIQLREDLLGKQKMPLLAELRELEERVMHNAAALQSAHMNRKNLVRQYWAWRQRVELGDAKAAKTFEEDVQRGPRFRHVGVQNVIQTESFASQVQWLRQLLSREELFRRHVQRVEVLVGDLNEVNSHIDRALVCPHCSKVLREAVTMWPCGHSFCLQCFDKLSISQHMHRCSVCYSVGAEGCIANALLSDILSKLAIRESGYSDLKTSLEAVKSHLQAFQKDKLALRLHALEYRLKQHTDKSRQ